jgi:hypothetical protein
MVLNRNAGNRVRARTGYSDRIKVKDADPAALRERGGSIGLPDVENPPLGGDARTLNDRHRLMPIVVRAN